MSAVTLPPSASILPRAPRQSSMGVSPTKAMPLRRATAQTTAMHPVSAAPSRFAVWRSLENTMDRYASYGALTLGVVALCAVVVL